MIIIYKSNIDNNIGYNIIGNNFKLSGDSNNIYNIMDHELLNGINNMDDVIMVDSDPNINIGGQIPGNLNINNIKQHQQNNIIDIHQINKKRNKYKKHFNKKKTERKVYIYII